MKTFVRETSILILLTGSLLGATGVAAETTNCTPVTSLPAVISSGGVYCFTQNLATTMTSGSAIEILANNVTLDMNGFKLGGMGAGPATTANGIYAYQRKNLTIRNGIVRGFWRGIHLDDLSPYTTSKGNLVENIRAEGNRLVGIFVEGKGSQVRNNQVIDTQGEPDHVQTVGIVVNGPSCMIENNQVSDTVTATGGGSHSAYGIIFSGAGCVVAGNYVAETWSSDDQSYGIYIAGSSATQHVTIKDNIINTAEYGIFFSGGTSGKYIGNITHNIGTTAYQGGGTAIGNNY